MAIVEILNKMTYNLTLQIILIQNQHVHKCTGIIKWVPHL